MQGQADVELNELGLAQAAAAAETLASEGIDVIYTSELRRAAATAEAVAEVTGAPLHEDARLVEVNVGSWSGQTSDAVLESFPEQRELFAKGIDYPRSSTGETGAQVGARGAAALGELAQRHKGQTVLVVTHGYFTQVVVAELLGLAGYGNRLAPLRNAHWCELRFLGDRWVLASYNQGSSEPPDEVGAADSPASQDSDAHDVRQ